MCLILWGKNVNAASWMLPQKLSVTPMSAHQLDPSSRFTYFCLFNLYILRLVQGYLHIPGIFYYNWKAITFFELSQFLYFFSKLTNSLSQL